jgi:hypothetical protein
MKQKVVEANGLSRPMVSNVIAMLVQPTIPPAAQVL